MHAGAVVAACHIGVTRRLAGDDAPPALAEADPPIGNGFGLVVRALTDALPAYPGATPRSRCRDCSCCAPTAPSSPPPTATGGPAGCRASRCPLAMSFSASDDTLAPDGSHVVTIWGQWYPYALADGADWDALADTEAQRLVDAVDRFAPGFADSVQRLYVQTPVALERELSLPRGNVMHVEMGLASMFGFRPTPALSGYRVPGLPGLYLAGASTHPGGGVSGNSGRSAARVVLGDRPARPAPAPRRAAPTAAGRVGPAVTATTRRAAVPRRGSARAAPRRWSWPRRCCATAIAYPLADGDGRNAISWAIVLLGAALSVVHAWLEPGSAHRPRRRWCSSAASPWRSRASGWPPASRTAATPTATSWARRCSASRSSCPWPG